MTASELKNKFLSISACLPLRGIHILTFLLLFTTKISAQSPTWFWAKHAGTSGTEKCFGASSDTAGNLYTTGFFTTPIFFGSFPLISLGSADIFVVKYDVVGNVIWAKSFGNINDEGGFGIISDSNGNLYVTGFFNSPTISFGSTTVTNNGSNDIFVVKLDAATGNVIWAKSDGNTGDDRGSGIKTDAFNNVYITGFFTSPTINFGSSTLTNAGGSDLFIAKYSGANGNRIWAKGAGGTGAENDNGALANDNGGSIATDANGNVFATGYFNSSAITFGSTTLINTTGSFDIFIVKYDSTGNAQWAKSAGGTGLNNDGAFKICTDVNGDAIITGAFDSPSIVFGSFTLTHPLSTSGDIFVVKYNNSNGNVIWAKNNGGLGDDLGYGICSDALGNIYVTGPFGSDSVVFGSTTLINTGAVNTLDIFVAKYDPNGNVLWAKNVGGSVDDYAYDIALDPTTGGGAYVTGHFTSPNISFGTTTLTNSGAADIYVAKLDETTSVSEINNSEGNKGIIIYPNPFNFTATVQLQTKVTNASFIIYNIYAEIVNSTIVSGDKTEISRANLPNGIYFISLTQNGKSIAKSKIIIRD